MIILFNPLSTTPGKQPLPLSLMSLAAVLEGREPWCLVDGNCASDPAAEIEKAIDRVAPGERTLLAVTVMPGPQLSQAIPVCRAIRRSRPGVQIVWGGYFPTQHADTVLASSYVDFVIQSQGERALLELVEALEGKRPFESVGSLSWKRNGLVVHNARGSMQPLDDLPMLPYHRVPMERYLHPTYLGQRTIAHNSSFGCPFSCSFCAVVAMSNRRWLAQSPERLESVLEHLVTTYAVDAVMMHDMDFFINEGRVAEFASRVERFGLKWWALGRIDTLMHYSDETWRRMARSGLKMVFSGAESASADTLAAMNKGGKSSPVLTIELAKRMRSYGVIPEYSFVLGSPPDPEGDAARTFEFIRAIKRVNPDTEVVLYTYTPVPMDGSMYRQAEQLGFSFPGTLDEWEADRWRQLMMRRGENIPYLDGSLRRRIRNFERVLNAFYPTATDRRLTPARRALLKTMSAWRYALKVYEAPLELRALHRLIHYQRPETTGF